MEKELKNAITILIKHLNSDKGYRYGWQANIAMAQKDAEFRYKKKTNKKYLNTMDRHIITNQGAVDFLDLLTAENKLNK